MERVLLDQVIMTEYGQFNLLWSGYGFDGIFERFFDGQVNGLGPASNPDAIYVRFGRRSGGSDVRIMLLDEPAELDSDSSWADETTGELGHVPSGSYRLPVSAKGRDEGHDGEFSEEVIDHYILEMWPATPKSDDIVGTESQSAEYWHKTRGSRR
ncbi:hypothetical protein [Paenarthrobacter aurescens]|uniref:hypothetical protein n=1 Tax=Paenarthrobacter aurescens TaxID=43663 RepID=UPI00114499B9|nr:hypothetical protein [Paenarthrobacter aurescens]MDO6143148.1 hypothetical protein [Paenarthrobacter aurescens]MDO6146994.1 hypothetical protein [Paenarthrobacter aurescens]MDO6158240.1 hypothetical protein [Paenarthrobacter aurescens]MDO6162224.1 hypothetical protein [Paenarthrobacter aurescens]